MDACSKSRPSEGRREKDLVGKFQEATRQKRGGRVAGFGSLVQRLWRNHGR